MLPSIGTFLSNNISFTNPTSFFYGFTAFIISFFMSFKLNFVLKEEGLIKFYFIAIGELKLGFNRAGEVGVLELINELSFLSLLNYSFYSFSSISFKLRLLINLYTL